MSRRELYSVVAQVIREVNNWRSSVGVPVFFVEAESALEAIIQARTILNPFGTDEVSGGVVRVRDRGDYMGFA